MASLLLVLLFLTLGLRRRLVSVALPVRARDFVALESRLAGAALALWPRLVGALCALRVAQSQPTRVCGRHAVVRQWQRTSLHVEEALRRCWCSAPCSRCRCRRTGGSRT
jgi:hypothetical protein